MKNTIILAACLALLGSAALAQTTPANINARQCAQHARIEQGKHQGSVSKKEAHRLRMQQQQIRAAECRAKADGIVTPMEGRMLHQKQNHANRSIHRAKHNDFNRKG